MKKLILFLAICLMFGCNKKNIAGSSFRWNIERPMEDDGQL
jgi:hypothetical protein